MNNTSKIELLPPYEGNIDADRYLHSIKNIIQKERESDPTIILHTDDEILSKYASSIVAVFEKKIVGNSSIYPTQMDPLSTLAIEGKNIPVGEFGSVIIHPDFRGMGLGKKITHQVIEVFAAPYKVIVGATVSDIMYMLMTHQGFQNIPFPKALYEEGKKYLAPFMQGGEQEFQKRARCMMYNLKLTEKEKNDLITLLQQEYIATSI